MARGMRMRKVDISFGHAVYRTYGQIHYHKGIYVLTAETEDHEDVAYLEFTEKDIGQLLLAFKQAKKVGVK